jgi:Pvc16 N-terminal domain
MSNHLAIAHVTAAIRQLVIESGALTGTGDIVFGRPTAPDSGARINIYLYHVAPHAGLRNADLPFRRGDMLVRRPQAALILHYLISFYGKDDELQPARMMAAVVRDLHAHAVLKADFIAQARTAHGNILTDSDLGDGERIILTPEALSLEDMSRLWSIMMQTPYALSVAYEAAVVLLDARESAPAPLPALRRGEEDRGPDAQTTPLPRIHSAWIGFPDTADLVPRPQSLRAAQLGARLLLEGVGLTGDTLRLDFVHASMPKVEIPLSADEPIGVTLPDDAAAQTAWAAGVHAVTATVTRDGREHRSPVLAMPLAPRVTNINPPSVTKNVNATLTLTCRPEVGKDQAVALLIGDREIAAEPRTGSSATVAFKFVPDAAMNKKLLFLRVDGVDSQPILFDPAKGAFVFDDNQRLDVA